MKDKKKSIIKKEAELIFQLGLFGCQLEFYLVTSMTRCWLTKAIKPN